MTEEGVRLSELKGRAVLGVDSGRELARVIEALFHPKSLRLEGLLCHLTGRPANDNDDTETLAGPYRVLGLSDLIAIGPHAVTVASATSLSIPAMRPALASLVDWESLLANDQGQNDSFRPRRPLFERLMYRATAANTRHYHRGTAAGIPQALAGARGRSGTASPQPPLNLEMLPVLTDRGERIGRLQDVLVDPKSGRLLGILMRELDLFRRFRSPILIPAAQVRSIGTDACIVRADSSDMP